ncbi:polysaccharide pyruvyl transferase family protein [Rhodococcus sp. NPDC019627]
MHVLIVGWSSVLHGEATAGDVLAMDAVRAELELRRIPHTVAWSAVMCPEGGTPLDEVDPRDCTHLVFVCGPLTGQPIAELHDRFAHCTRIALGVSIIDRGDPVVTRFHTVIPRDGHGPAVRDLSAGVPTPTVPVIGVYLTSGQREYGARRRHDTVRQQLSEWLCTMSDCAFVELDTRLDPRDWRQNATPAHTESIIRKLDAVITMRLHGFVLAVKNSVPALAVDPVSGGGKVSAQAAAWSWPGLVTAEEVSPARLSETLSWVLSDAGRGRAADLAEVSDRAGREQLDALMSVLPTVD